ncbi:MAG TPA: hypothetical protein PLF40_32245, partial [Kofleriaceae bacterium]|nr:hypothetical protein [Kofleriaceae bacterium]
RLFQRKTDYLTFRAVMEQPVPDLRRYRQDVTPQLMDVVARALSRDVAERFSTVRELGASILDASPGVRAWSNSEIGDFLKSNFAEVIRKRSATLMMMTRRDSGPELDRAGERSERSPVGRSTMPLLTDMSTSDQESDTDDDEFPSVESDVHEGVVPPARPSSESDFAVQTPPPFSQDLQTVQGVQALVAELRRTGTMQAMHVEPAPPPRRSILLPILGISLVGIAGTALFLLWQQSKNQAAPPPPIVITPIARPVVDASPASVAVVDAPGSAAVVGAGSGSGKVNGKGPDKNPNIKKPDDTSAKSKATKIIQANMGSIQACGSTFDPERNKDWSGLSIHIMESGQVKSVELEPSNNTFTPFGACVRSAIGGIVFAGLNQELTLRVPMRAPG